MKGATVIESIYTDCFCQSQTKERSDHINISFVEIEAIAKGIEAQIDPFSIISKVITQRTVEISRQIGIDENDIQQWIKAREKYNSLKNELTRMVISSYDDTGLDLEHHD